jgi:hypothetical protein
VSESADSAPLALRSPATALAGAWLAALLATMFHAGGASSLGVALGAGLPLVALIVACALAAVGRIRPLQAPRAAWIALAALAAWAGVAFASISWSLLPANSWIDALRTVCAAASFACGLWLAPRLGRPLAYACLGVTALAGISVGWAIIARSSARFLGPTGTTRLQEPLPYPNALGILCAAAILAALWTATRRELALRVGGGAVIGLCLYALPLTGSRGSVLALVAGLAVWLSLEPRRLELAAALAAGFVGALPSILYGASLPTFAALPDDLQTPLAAGPGIVAAGVAAIVAAGALSPLALALVDRMAAPVQARATRVLAWAGGAVAALGVIAYAVRHGGPLGAVQHVWDGLAGGGGVGNGTSRLTSVSGNLRGRWWHEGWHAFTSSPWYGHGADTFAVIDNLLRPSYDGNTKEEHSAALHVLAGLGLLGAVPAVIALVAIAWAGITALQRQSAERPAAIAVLAVLTAFVLHAQLDWDWTFTVLTMLAFSLAGMLAASAREPTRIAPDARLLCGLAIPALGVSLALALTPYLSDHALARSRTLQAQGRLDEALIEADLAHGFFPLSQDPLLQQADLMLALGRRRQVESTVAHMIRLQPLDWTVWSNAGLYQTELGDRAAACNSYRWAARLSGHNQAAVDAARTACGAS